MLALIALLALAQDPAAPPPSSAAEGRARVVVVAGTPGSPDYAADFARWAGLWADAASKGGAEVVRIGDRPIEPGAPTDRDRLKEALAAPPAGPNPGPLWVVLIGHGTFDGREAKFNLRGPDVSDADLAGWLAPAKGTVAVVDGSSASGPFLKRLSGRGRIVVTATRSGDEQNFARLGGRLAEAIADPKSDLDKDGGISLLEAFLTAANRVAESYKSQSRLATEHPLIDDNGDALGTPAEWFDGLRATRRAKDGAAADGLRAQQLHLIPGARDRALSPEARRRRDELELAVAALRDRKAGLPEDDYYAQLEPLLLELARIYRDLPDFPRPSKP